MGLGIPAFGCNVQPKPRYPAGQETGLLGALGALAVRFLPSAPRKFPLAIGHKFGYCLVVVSFCVNTLYPNKAFSCPPRTRCSLPAGNSTPPSRPSPLPPTCPPPPLWCIRLHLVAHVGARKESLRWRPSVTLSPCHPVTLSPCHPVTLSPCHLVTLSPCHTYPPPPLRAIRGHSGTWTVMDNG